MYEFLHGDEASVDDFKVKYCHKAKIRNAGAQTEAAINSGSMPSNQAKIHTRNKESSRSIPSG